MFYTQSGNPVGTIGQGTWEMGDISEAYFMECKSLTLGIERGMNLIDTAEMYGDGRAELLVGDVIKDFGRKNLYLVSKVYPWNAGKSNIYLSCENSLKRLKSNYLDLYLLHWPGQIPLEETVFCMEKLKQEGKIINWGVSNFDTIDMEALLKVPDGNKCIANQVLYHLGSRGIEYDLLPWMDAHQMVTMAYCPLAQSGRLHKNLIHHPVLVSLSQKRQITVHQALLAFLLSRPNVLPIPRSGNPAHTISNAAAMDIRLTSHDLVQLDEAFAPPTYKMPLDIE